MRLLSRIGLAALACALTVLYTNCSGFQTPSASQEVSQSSLSVKCAHASASQRHLQSINDAIALINALPKPLTLDCFLYNIDAPLSVYNVNNTASAQPAINAQNPRIFIIKTPLLLSVVPAGPAAALLEMSELISSTQSVKAELKFPITSNVVTEDAFSSLAATIGVGTDCRFCHTNETLAGGSFAASAYKSDIIAPAASQRIITAAMRREASACDPSVDAYRCAILSAVFIDGAATDGTFP